MFTWSRVVPCNCKYPNTSEVIWCGWRMGILEVITVWCLGFDWAAPGLQWGPGGEAGVRSSFAPRHRGRETNITPYLVKCHPETVRNCPLNENRERYFHRITDLKCSFRIDITRMNGWSDQAWDAPSQPSPSSAYSFPHHQIATIHSWKQGSFLILGEKTIQID